DPAANPNQEKRRLARAIVGLYHGDRAGAEAERQFDLVYREHELPPDIPTEKFQLTEAGRVWLPRLLYELGWASSNSEGRRLVEQGAVRIDGEAASDPAREYAP